MNKNALLGYSWARILKSLCHILNQHPRIYLIAKFCEEAKMPKFGAKNALFGFFGLEYLKTFVIFKIKNEPLTHTVNLGIGSGSHCVKNVHIRSYSVLHFPGLELNTGKFAAFLQI